MALRSKARKEQAEPGATPALSHSDTDSAGENVNGGSERARVRRRAPRPAQTPGEESDRPTRDCVHTVDERMKALTELPSLHTGVRDALAKTPAVDMNAPPPEALAEPATEPAAPAEFDKGAPIPENYGMDRMASLVRDPYWIFCYWELKGGILERLRFDHSAEVIDNSRWVLRVRTPLAPPSTNAGCYFVDISLKSNQWYLKVTPNTLFSIDLGFINQQGHFVMVLQGNEVHTPRVNSAAVADENWFVQREDLERLLQASGSEMPSSLSTGGASRQSQRMDVPRAGGVLSAQPLRSEKEQE